MSLCPNCVSGAPNNTYFPPKSGAVLEAPVINPVSEGASGTLEMRNYDVFGVDPDNSTRVVHYMPKTTGGGLSENHYQCFMYGAVVGGNDVGEVFDVYGANNNYTIMSMNQGRPLDAGRVGYITGTGAVQNIVCPSCNVNSIVGFAYVGGAAAAGAIPLAAIANGVGFSVTLPAGAIYLYNVLG
jgi:hypothetical protein